jgi:hypothetical protein
MPSESNPASDAELARLLAKLWPHRVHESSAGKALLCRLGLHRWAQLDLSLQAQGREVCFCRWCDRIRIDGEMFVDSTRPTL